MIKNLITHQEVILTETHPSADYIREIIREMKSKKELTTAILMIEESERSLLLFILQDDPCFCYALRNNVFSPLSISEYLGEGENHRGDITLYKISPIFFKTLLVLAQKKPDAFAGSDLINIEHLLKHLNLREQDAVLSLRKGEESSLFYFIRGKLSEGHFENESELMEESLLHDQLLVYTYSATREEPVTFSLYYDVKLAPVDAIGDSFSESPESSENPVARNPLLILVEGKEQDEDDKPDQMTVDKKVFTLGRDPENDWTMDDPAASRKHAGIERCEDGFYIEDRESRNGTFVNQEKIQRHKLSHGDKIQIGVHFFIYSEKDEASIEHASSLVADDGDISASIDEEIQQDFPETKEPPLNWGLVIISGDMAGTFFKLSSRSLSLGRGNTDICVKDPQVSRHHANIVWTTKGFVLSDCKSANGVSINGDPITTKQLVLQDIIKVGDTRLRVVSKE